MFDDDDGVASVHQAVQQLHDLLNIRSVESGGGLVQHINIALLVQIFVQLHPLAFTAGKRGQGLPQGKIWQAHLRHGLQSLAQLPVFLKEFTGFPGRHIQNFNNVLSFIPIGQSLRAVTLALAGFTDSGDRVHENQLRDDPTREPSAAEEANFVENFVPGALYTETCLCTTAEEPRVFEIAAVQANIVYNDYGWHDPQGRFFVLKEDIEKEGTPEDYLAKVESGCIRPEPLIIRANAGECIEVRLTNFMPERSKCPGDYLYRSGSLRWDVESGMWGIFRVLSRSIRYHCESACRSLRQWWERKC